MTADDPRIGALRRQLVVRLSRTAGPLGAIIVAINWWQFARDPAWWSALVGVTLSVGAIFAAGFVPAPRPVRAALLEGGLVGALVVTSLRTGPLPGALGCAAAASLLAGFLFSTRVALLVTSAVACWLAVVGVTHAGATPPLPLQRAASDLGVAANWVRTGLTMFALMLFVVVALVGYLRNLTDVLAGERDALDMARAEDARRKETVETRERADAERRRAQGLLALGKLGGGFSHEVSNRLTAIRAELDWIALHKTREGPSVVGEAVTDMIEAVDGAGAVLRRLLALSARDIVHAGVSADLADVVRGAQKQLAGVRGLRVVTTVEPCAPVRVDLPSLHGVLINLALNARDAMGDGGTLRLEARPSTDAERAQTDCVGAIDVVDTGPGMDEAVQARLFEPFFTTKGSRGTGLGLHAARRVVEQCGGVLRVASTPGKGTRFTVLLREGSPIRPRSRAAATPASAEGGAPVLIVDDDLAVRRAWTRALVGQGLKVFEAGDVDEALAIVRKEPLVLAWIDAVMPGRPTRELVAELKRLQPACHRVICSGHVEEELLRRDLQLGDAEFVAKPCGVRELVSRARTGAVG